MARTPQCDLPSDIPAAREIPPPVDQAPRRAAVAGYLLALSWSPEYCRGKQDRAADRLQCGSGKRFGFILHGLWPQAASGAAPQWCRPAKALPPALVRRHLCETPSVQLLQREWARHGSCAARSATGYFQAASLLYGVIRYPDMDALSRRGVTVSGFKQALAGINPGIQPAAIMVDANDRGWLREVRLCLGRRMRPRSCPGDDRSAPDDMPLKIWRGR